MSVMVKNKTNKNYKRSQKGRSMVEMLGVLAIIGVLSVGGVYGYGVAMKKHKANELLHQASMLATTISAQAMTNDGALPQTITSFGNSSYGNFSTSVTDALDGKGFSITIENVDSGACTQLEKMAGGMVRDVTCDDATGDATITYYKNLATNDEEGKNSPTGGETVSRDVGVCENGNVYLSYMGEGNECDTAAPENMGCKKNSDCDSGEYCKITGSWKNNCSVITEGMCETLDAGTEKTYTYGGTSKTLLLGGKMSWWAAENWCKAHNKSLVKAMTLGCTISYDSGGCPYSEMNSAGLVDDYWLGNNYDSCDTYTAFGSYAAIATYNRHNDQAKALCEQP